MAHHDAAHPGEAAEAGAVLLVCVHAPEAQPRRAWGVRRTLEALAEEPLPADVRVCVAGHVAPGLADAMETAHAARWTLLLNRPRPAQTQHQGGVLSDKCDVVNDAAAAMLAAHPTAAAVLLMDDDMRWEPGHLWRFVTCARALFRDTRVGMAVPMQTDDCRHSSVCIRSCAPHAGPPGETCLRATVLGLAGGAMAVPAGVWRAAGGLLLWRDHGVAVPEDALFQAWCMSRGLHCVLVCSTRVAHAPHVPPRLVGALERERLASIMTLHWLGLSLHATGAGQ